MTNVMDSRLLDQFELDFKNSSFQSDSETTSLASIFVKGYIENGRKYSSLRDGYWAPCDEKRLEVDELANLVYLVMRRAEANVLFAAPVVSPKNILDVSATLRVTTC